WSKPCVPLGARKLKSRPCASFAWAIRSLLPEAFFPTKTGADYEMTKELQPLERHRKDFTIFSHVHHDIAGGHRAVHSFAAASRIRTPGRRRSPYRRFGYLAGRREVHRYRELQGRADGRPS